MAMKNDEPLVKGGCGHSAEDVEFSAKIIIFVCFVFLFFLLISIFA
jgi:hypothetical protein